MNKNYYILEVSSDLNQKALMDLINLTGKAIVQGIGSIEEFEVVGRKVKSND